jgi:hypothetical protein
MTVLWWLDGFNALAIPGFSFYALAIALASASCFIHVLNFYGKRSLGEPSIHIFKAFLLVGCGFK